MAAASLDSMENCIVKASLKEEEHSIGLAEETSPNSMEFHMRNKIATDFLWVQASYYYYYYYY